MKKVLSFALMALAMGFVFVSCDNEKEEGAKSYTLSPERKVSKKYP